ncbi:MAG: PspC domain-containing protein [Bacteroidetes bacterium]|nr:PspC domain-containing protein [Bacteroidota bacterium]
MEKRLYRNTGNKMIGGVCTGLAEYFAIDPVLIRLVFVILALHHGIGILAYVILWIVVPARLQSVATESETGEIEMEAVANESYAVPPTMEKKEPGRGSFIGGIVLIVIGALFLLDNFIPSFGFEDFWPLLLIAIGAGMLWNTLPRSNHDNGEVAS